MSARASRLAILGPGLLVAATGVGAGDLATAAFTGSVLGTSVLWAVVLGAFFKFVLNEGLARWQLATGETLLEGVLGRVPRPARFLFLLYFLPWSWFVGSALVGACGVTTHALLPVFDDATTGKIVFGVACSGVGLAIALRGGFRAFERLMSVSVALMFAATIATAVALRPDVGEVLRGLFVPSVPDADGRGPGWTIALMGGVGGTLTVLCYGYWIREVGREGPGAIATCRIDLVVGYAATALFGLAMVVVGSTIEVEGKGSGLVVALAQRLDGELGPAMRLVFLVGAWSAVFSSLVGVWQSVPYLFADFWSLARGDERPASASLVASAPYRVWSFALAIVPLGGLWLSFKEVQKLYAIVGACFMPLLALALLVLLRRGGPAGVHANRVGTVLVLAVVVAFFAWAGWIGAAG
ncbi:MAG: Nramp family divalent metal transporter [Planctomycetota bacterium]